VRRIGFGWIACLLLVFASAADAAERVRVALLPIVVRSAEDRDYLQQGLSDMLVARLARDERLAVVPVDDAKAATTDVAAARETAKAHGAEFVLFGSFTRFGEGASLELLCASVRDEEKEPRHIYVHAPTMGALMPLLDGAAQRATFAVLGVPPAGPAVSTGPKAQTAPEPTAPEPRTELPRQIDNTDGAIGNRERRAPGLPSDTGSEDLR